MSDRLNIQYLTHSQIDKTKWDECITHAPNGLIYAYSFYLDHMAKNWDALILNDYDAVMPLTWNKKYNIHYLYQPFLAAQLGVFGKNTTEEMTGKFIRAIPVRFKLIEICLNSDNIINSPSGSDISRSNYVLDLNKPYEELYQSYKDNIKRNIKKAKQIGCHATKDFDVEKVIELAVQQMRSYGEESASNVERFRKLFKFLHAKQMAITYGILSPQNELIASCVFFFSHKRCYYILVGNHPDGRTIGASHALIDEFIKDHAGKNMLLDFEGSDIRNLAFFYSSFGARHEVYPALKINRLPFYLKWLKK
ncbi:MAG: GNAT family N-acetyltransferase [Chitinophagaceae bacterium]|nr:GNAT family N-acetyltransferase [Chitinophagaceae bacterium]